MLPDALAYAVIRVRPRVRARQPHEPGVLGHPRRSGTERFTRRTVYTQNGLHTERFTHRTVYAQNSLRTERFTHTEFNSCNSPYPAPVDAVDAAQVDVGAKPI